MIPFLSAQDFVERILGIGHIPKDVSKNIKNLFTLEKYLEVFGEHPPTDIWPSPNSRFKNADKFIRLNGANYWFLKKPSELFLPLVATSLFLVACTSPAINS